jgi:hypothetical protein
MCDCRSIMKGAAGLAAAGAGKLTGLGRAPAKVISDRRDACAKCRHAVQLPYLNALGAFCGAGDGLKCLISAKTSLASERCPLEPPEWLDVSAAPVE